LGAHIDHQGGAVLGAPLSAHSLLVAARLTDLPLLRIHAVAFVDSGPSCEIRLDDPQVVHLPATASLDAPPMPSDWSRYAVAAARVLTRFHGNALKHGLVAGVSGALPACGVSSSASVGLAYIAALAHVNEIALQPLDFVRLDRQLENECLGLRCGMLDPASIVLGQRNALVRIDTRSGLSTVLPLPLTASPFKVLLVHSGVPRHLATKGSGYNNRVAECRAAAQWLGARANIADAALLSDIPAEVWRQHADELQAHDAAAALRARHYFSEVERVERGIVAWQAGDWPALGALMNESCQSSSQNYQCGCEQLEVLHRIIVDTPGVYGARWSGAGFGGAEIGFVAADRFDENAAASIRSRYLAAFPELAAEFELHSLDLADGLRVFVSPHP
jgi:galacturonokinase